MFDKVAEFESAIAEFYGAPYAVAVDCCTHAIELSLRYNKVCASTCPTNTYISIPFTFKKLNMKWKFEDKMWKDYYYLGNTNIIDAAVYWQAGGYVPNTLMCLSFQFKKHLSLGRGGAILCSTIEQYSNLKRLSYDGRNPNIPWAEQDIDTAGYHYYMTPETAQLGLDLLPQAKVLDAKRWTYKDYPYLPNMKVFNE